MALEECDGGAWWVTVVSCFQPVIVGRLVFVGGVCHAFAYEVTVHVVTC